jgi:Heterokaryon incompatibility protein (HET)
MSAFSYSKLPKENDIRLLIVQPGAENAPIVCNLVVREGNEPYEALSWSWGDLPPNITIYIVNENGQKEPLLIKPNLAVALKNLRKQDSLRALWIDAICMQAIPLNVFVLEFELNMSLGINQNDFEERSGQVSMMRDIYGEATNVCIWLGVEEADSLMAMEFIQDEILPLIKFDDLINPENTKYSKRWDALATLMRREWFSRRWVVQVNVHHLLTRSARY